VADAEYGIDKEVGFLGDRQYLTFTAQRSFCLNHYFIIYL